MESPRAVAGLGIFEHLTRELPEAAFHCLFRGDLDCSLANDLLRDCLGVVGRITTTSSIHLQVFYNSKIYTVSFGDLHPPAHFAAHRGRSLPEAFQWSHPKSQGFCVGR